MRRKLGLSTSEQGDRQLAEDLLQAMQRNQSRLHLELSRPVRRGPPTRKAMRWRAAIFSTRATMTSGRSVGGRG